MTRWLLMLLCWPGVAWAVTACVESPTGYWTCGGAVIVSDNNTSLPTPGANVLRVTGNNASIPVMPTPTSNQCMFFDMDAGATTTCVLSNGTTLMHIPPLGTELPKLLVTTQTAATYSPAGTADEMILCDATAANIVITLPAPGTVGSGRRISVKKIDATGHTCTVNPNASEKIDGQSSQVISARYTDLPVITDGTNWYIQ